MAAPLDRAGDKEDAGGGAGANGPRSRARPVHDEDDLDRSQPSDSVGSGSHGALAQQRLGEWPTGPTPSSAASSGAASSGASSSAASASASAGSAAAAAAGALAPAGAAGAGAVGLAGTATAAVDELVVTDNRTGRELRVPISEDGVVAAALFKQLRLNDEDHGTQQLLATAWLCGVQTTAGLTRQIVPSPRHHGHGPRPQLASCCTTQASATRTSAGPTSARPTASLGPFTTAGTASKTWPNGPLSWRWPSC